MSNEFSFYDEKVYRIFILREVEIEIEKLKDVKAQKKILDFLDRLLERIPNSPEQQKNLEGCQTAYELKPKPYRLGCFLMEEEIFQLYIFGEFKVIKIKLNKKKLKKLVKKLRS